jgi:mono/diheme cytochrome c family protein
MSLTACTKTDVTDCADPKATMEDPVEHGKYLVTISGCNDCHTPKIMTDQGPVPDMTRMLSGHPATEPLAPYDKSVIGPWVMLSSGLTAAVGPWGTSFSANLTPSESGIGSWTEEQFLKAITEGKHMGMDNTRPIMPPMPWQEVKKMKTEDLKAVFAYLKSIPPVDNVVPAYMPPAN